MAENQPNQLDRIERIFATIVASVIGLSLLCFIILLIGGLMGLDVSGGVWPVIAWIPYFGLPVGFILIVVLLVIGVRRRGKAAKVGQRR